MFLESSALGPFYTLYNFKCTDKLDGSLHTLKLAGVLRYNVRTMCVMIIILLQEKELQVLFGHIKSVFLDSSSGDIWVQASSGMYVV